jgi:hypothetical protein
VFSIRRMQPVTQNLRQPDATPEPSSDNAGLVSKRARTIVMAVLTIALSLAASYGIGWAEGSARTTALEQHAVQQKAGHEKSADQLREHLAQLERRANLLEARRFLHRSLMALELDNFGTARQHLAKAHQLVAAAQPVPGSQLSSFKESLVGVELGVAADPLPQRVALTQLAQNFDQLLNE